MCYKCFINVWIFVVAPVSDGTNRMSLIVRNCICPIASASMMWGGSGLSLGAWASLLGDSIDRLPIHSTSSSGLSLPSVRRSPWTAVQTITVRPDESSPALLSVLSPKLVPPVSSELNMSALLMVDSWIFCGHRFRVDAAVALSRLRSVVGFPPSREMCQFFAQIIWATSVDV